MKWHLVNSGLTSSNTIAPWQNFQLENELLSSNLCTSEEQTWDSVLAPDPAWVLFDLHIWVELLLIYISISLLVIDFVYATSSLGICW